MSDIYARIQELENQKLEAERAEQERLAAERLHRERIEQADAELRQLRQQAANEQFERARQDNTRMVEQNMAAIPPMLDALNAIGQQLATVSREQVMPIDALFQQQQQHMHGAIAAVVQDTDFSEAIAQSQHGGNAYGRAISMAQGKAASQFTNGLPVWAALAQWIADAPDASTRQWRTGITYAITGQTFNPGADYSARREVDRILLNERNARRF